MDPLHPLVPIQPSPPMRPDYTRVQRVAREEQREAEPDWQRSEEDDADGEQREEQFEDDYDPDWSDTAAAEAYDDHGAPTEAMRSEAAPEPAPRWNPRRDGDRRDRPRPAEDSDDDTPGPHIDITA